MSRLGKILLILIVLAAVTVGVYAVARNSKKKDGSLKEVEVTQGTIVEKAVAVGQIQPRQKFQVKSKISGIVRRALVEVGDTVKAGDPLFEIAPDPTPCNREKYLTQRSQRYADAGCGPGAVAEENAHDDGCSVKESARQCASATARNGARRSALICSRRDSRS
jgi:multidrug resistance efflux pump